MDGFRCYYVPPEEGETPEEYDWRVLEKSVSRYIRWLFERKCGTCEDKFDCVLSPRCTIVLLIRKPPPSGDAKVWFIQGFLTQKLGGGGN
jgi:hypothetical protein